MIARRVRGRREPPADPVPPSGGRPSRDGGTGRCRWRVSRPVCRVSCCRGRGWRGGRTNAENGTTDNAESCRFILFLYYFHYCYYHFSRPIVSRVQRPTTGKHATRLSSSSSRGSFHYYLFIYLFSFVFVLDRK